jgi:hypothetical protein
MFWFWDKMIWDFILMLALGLFVWYLIMVLKWKRKLKKIREGYNAEEDKSRPSENFRREFRRDKPGREPSGIVGAGTEEEPTTDANNELAGQGEFQDEPSGNTSINGRKSKQDWDNFD